MEDGARAKERRQPLEAGKGKEMDSPLKFPEETQPFQHLDLSPVRFHSSDLQNRHRMNLWELFFPTKIVCRNLSQQ